MPDNWFGEVRGAAKWRTTLSLFLRRFLVVPCRVLAKLVPYGYEDEEILFNMRGRHSVLTSQQPLYISTSQDSPPSSESKRSLSASVKSFQPPNFTAKQPTTYPFIRVRQVLASLSLVPILLQRCSSLNSMTLAAISLLDPANLNPSQAWTS